MTVSFKISRRDEGLVSDIADRAEALGLVQGEKAPDHWYTRKTCLMDLTATHANGCPMDFARMLAADDLNFLHDIAGIAKHIDRTSGQLGGCFLPRFARPEPAGKAVA